MTAYRTGVFVKRHSSDLVESYKTARRINACRTHRQVNECARNYRIIKCLLVSKTLFCSTRSTCSIKSHDAFAKIRRTAEYILDSLIFCPAFEIFQRKLFPVALRKLLIIIDSWRINRKAISVYDIVYALVTKLNLVKSPNDKRPILCVITGFIGGFVLEIYRHQSVKPCVHNI